MKRNAIIRALAQIQDEAKLAGCLAMDATVPKWASIEGEAQRLSNMACEAQHKVSWLRKQLADLKSRYAALKGAKP